MTWKIKDNKSNQVWDKEKKRIIPLLDQFDLSGKYKNATTLSVSAITNRELQYWICPPGKRAIAAATH